MQFLINDCNYFRFYILTWFFQLKSVQIVNQLISMSWLRNSTMSIDIIVEIVIEHGAGPFFTVKHVQMQLCIVAVIIKEFMGTGYSYKCDNYFYLVESYGAIYFEEQFKDHKSHMIPDFVIDEKDKFFCCKKCYGKNNNSWDSHLRRCPKLIGWLSIDSSISSIHWN